VCTLVGSARSARADSSLVAVAGQLTHDLGTVPPGALVAASSHTIAAPRGDELAEQVATLVAAALGNHARASEAPQSLAAARVRAGLAKTPALVYLDVRVDGGELRLTADVYAVIPNGWDRLRSPPAVPGAHVYLHVPIGAEVRSYLPPLDLLRARVTKIHYEGGPILALACGDLDGDGGDDLVVVSARELAWGHLTADRFDVTRRALASTVGRRLPVPMREPLASAVLLPGDTAGSLYVGWGDRIGAVLGPDLVPHGALAGLPLADGTRATCVSLDAARGGFVDARVGCLDGKSVPGVAGVPGAPPLLADTWMAFDLERGERLVAARDTSGTLHLTLGHEVLAVNDVGAQIALVDLDQDGVPEVVTTNARGEDAIVVSSLKKGALVPRLRWPAPAGVDAIAVCSLGADNAPSLVAAVGGEIWLVH